MNYRVKKLEDAKQLLDPKNQHAFEGLKAQLLGRDPLAMLAHIGLDKVKDMSLLGFENTYPGIKTLNDEVFRGDHALTDEFMERVQAMLKDEMGDEIIPVNLFVKGGFLLLKNQDPAKRDELLDRFEKNAARILVSFLAEKAESTGDSHYSDQADLYREKGMAFSYGSAKWPEGELTMQGAAETLALTTGMLKYGVSRASQRSPERDNENPADERRQPKVIEMTKAEYIEELKKGLKASWARAFEIYQKALEEGNTEKLKAFCVTQKSPNSVFTLFDIEVFSALRKGKFKHGALSAFTEDEKKALNAYRKAVNSMDVITAYTRNSQGGYFKSIQKTLEAIEDRDLDKMRDFARVSHKDPILHQKEGLISELDEHCIFTRARLAEVFADEIQIEEYQLVNVDIIGFGYINHVALAKLVPHVCNEEDTDKIMKLLSCPLDEANEDLDKMRFALRQEIIDGGLIDGEGGDEMVVLRRGHQEWTLVRVPGSGAFRVASFNINTTIPPEYRMVALAKMMEGGDKFHAEIKKGHKANPVNTGYVFEEQ